MVKRKFPKIIYFLVCFLLIFEQSGFAQIAGQLDIAGRLADFHNSLTVDRFRPLHLRYLQCNLTQNSFKLLIDKGSLKGSSQGELENTSKELLKYFLIGISLPNGSFWVNLRPDAQDEIIDDDLAKTDVGRIMLEADIQLKKDTAKFTSPETLEGKEYWDKLYRKAGELFSTQNITIPTLTRPWIVPDEIIIRETTDSAYVYKATLKVMLEQDFIENDAIYNFNDERLKQLNEYSSQLIKETVIPKLTKEINNAKRYAPLRQVYYSLILAQWFKSRFNGKPGTYSENIDRKDLANLVSKQPWSKSTYFQEYKQSFENGEYSLKESVFTPFGRTIRSYFSGGITGIAPIVPAMGALPAKDPSTGMIITVSPAVNDLAENNPNCQAAAVQFTDNPENIKINLESGVAGNAMNKLLGEAQLAAGPRNIVEVPLTGEDKVIPGITSFGPRVLGMMGMGGMAAENESQGEKNKKETASRELISNLLQLESKLNDLNWSVRQAAAEALGLVYQALVEKGTMRLSALESKLNDLNWSVRQAAAHSLGLVYQALVKEGKEVSLSALESKLNDPDWLV
ncbi:MAG: HEAT repeat domain-containing protein, partial [Candidatus Omnitrophica bacterium]|nr:HEAT repeat domain-containing protein [Candidatus Omnitrophota bacterium]